MFRLPRFKLVPPVSPRLVQHIEEEQRTAFPVVHCTLAELEEAVHTDGYVGIREWGLPSYPVPGMRWISRSPSCWRAWSYELMLRPCFLAEITSLAPTGKPGSLLIYRWQIEIAGEDLAQNILRWLGKEAAYAALRN